MIGPGRAETDFLAISELRHARLDDTMGGGKKEGGEENLTNDTPPKKGFWTPPPRTVQYVFQPPSGVRALFFFPVQKSKTQSRPEALFGGVQKFSGECVLWETVTVMLITSDDP